MAVLASQEVFVIGWKDEKTIFCDCAGRYKA